MSEAESARSLKNRLWQTAQRLTEVNPQISIEEKLYWKEKTIKVELLAKQGGRVIITQDDCEESISNLVCPRGAFVELVNRVIARVNQLAEQMDEFYKLALDAEMGEIVMDSLAGNSMGLRERFCQKMANAVVEIARPLKLLDPPYEDMKHGCRELDGKLALGISWTQTVLTVVCGSCTVEMHRRRQPAPLNLTTSLALFQHLPAAQKFFHDLAEEAKAIQNLRSRRH